MKHFYDLSGLEVTHCIVVFVLSLDLLASQVCACPLKLFVFYPPKTGTVSVARRVVRAAWTLLEIQVSSSVQ